MRHREALTRILLALILASVPAIACTLIPPKPVQVGRNFRVRVQDRGRPVKGLRMTVRSAGTDREIAAIVTDESGMGQFSQVPSGHYMVGPERGAGMLGGRLVLVLGDDEAELLSFRWPDPTPVTTRNLRGVLHTMRRTSRDVQRSLSLTLIEGLSGRAIKSSKTAGDGAFDFGKVPAGIYFLRVNSSGSKGSPEEQIEGEIAVEVTPESDSTALDLDLAMTGCGLTYAVHGNGFY